MPKLPAKLVMIESQSREFRIPLLGYEPPSIVSLPHFLVLDGEVHTEGRELVFRLRATGKGRGLVNVNLGGRTDTVPAVSFAEREFFLAMVISSNYHIGFDPLSYLMGDTPEELDVSGHAWPKTRQLERMYHKRGIPVTWLLDKVVADEAADSIERWHLEHFDDYAVLPSSLFNHNEVNYNVKKSPAETFTFLKDEVEAVKERFSFDANTAGIDQWIGSVGSNFVSAAYELGLKGLWGIGYDHRTCDTSMLHKGCPWDVYKPSKSNYRIPAHDPSDLWIFQWTVRDIINSIHTPDDGPGGSVIFSTDPDDVRISEIMFAQHDYWIRMLSEYKSNMDRNDFFVFLVHQEDHDCHYQEDAWYLRNFLDNLPEGVTPATLEEITQWLNLKYSPEEHPSQSLYIHDPLTCHDKVSFYAGVKTPEDWPSEGEQYPAHVAGYDRDCQWIFPQGSSVPIRWFDYAAHHSTPETGTYPEGAIPRLEITDETWRDEGGNWVYQATVESDSDVNGLPVCLWNKPEDLKSSENAVLFSECAVVKLDIRRGRHRYSVNF